MGRLKQEENTYPTNPSHSGEKICLSLVVGEADWTWNGERLCLEMAQFHTNVSEQLALLLATFLWAANVTFTVR